MERDTHAAGLLAIELSNFQIHCGTLVREWNGEDDSKLEQRAMMCKEIIDECEKLQVLLAEFASL